MKAFSSTQALLSGAAVAFGIVAASMALAADSSVLPTRDDKVETYWSAKYWTVFKNHSRQSCFIEWRSENSVVQAGLTLSQDAAYLGAFLKDVEVEQGEQGIAISVNDNVYVGNVTSVSGTLSGGFNGGYILFDDPRFLSDLEKAREFVAFPGAPYTVKVALKTPKNAIDRARACMDEL